MPPETDNHQTHRFLVKGMHCAGCVQRIETALARVPGLRPLTWRLARRE